ncbi:MAG: c-type cytochrome, partial [Pirellula sp.]|nr:c-type cytochrome [Pirellula sp.]
TQFIRSHDGWGNWFGNDNTHPIYHYVLDRNWASQGKRRIPGMSRFLTQPADSPVIYPLSPALDRFNDPLTANRYTSVCSTIINLSSGNGDSMIGAAIVCEPVHNLVSRMSMKRDGLSWQANRFTDDSSSEWIRSHDPWFRPVRVVNAPDGSIWIADMYRRVIEHPTWIPEEWLARLDVYAGKEQGRIYRVYHESHELRQPMHIDQKTEAELIALLGDANNAIADWAQQQWIWRFSKESTDTEAMDQALLSTNPKVRIRAFSILRYLGRLRESQIAALLNDPDQRIVAYVLGQLLRDETIPNLLVQQIASSEWKASMVDPLLAMKMVLCLINHGDSADQRNAKRCCDLLLEHSAVNGFDAILELANSDRVGAVVDELIDREDPRGTIFLNRFIPRMETKALVRVVDRIAEHKGVRPAWHFLMARQLGMNANGVSINSDLIDQIYVDAKELLLAKDSSEARKLAAWEFYLSRLTDDSTTQVKELVVSIPLGNGSFAEKMIAGLYRLGGQSQRTLLEAARQWPSSLQSSTLSLFASHPQGIEMLLDEIEHKRLTASSVTPSQLEIMRQNSQGSLADRVVKWFGKDETVNRQEAIERYEQEWPANVEMGPGKQLFEVHCAKCHRGDLAAGVTEAPIGPSLQALSHWTNRAWLEAIIEPSRAVDQKYKRSLIRTSDNLVVAGLIRQETETAIELVLTDGRLQSIQKSDIEEIKSSDQSLMPDGFEKTLTPEQIAQIVTYLRRVGD